MARDEKPGRKAGDENMNTMQRRTFIKTAGAATLGMGLSSGVASAALARRPNIIFIMADDMGYGHVGAYNAKSKARTKNIDALAGAGRMFTEQDDLDHLPVMIINETMARRYWPNEDPIGARVALPSTMNDGARGVFDVVGVVGDLHDTNLELDPQPCMYVCHHQMALRFITHGGELRTELPVRWITTEDASDGSHHYDGLVGFTDRPSRVHALVRIAHADLEVRSLVAASAPLP